MAERDDLAVEYAHLLVTAGRPAEALAVLDGRRFQPWEGGEGQVLRAWERTQLALADAALAATGTPRPRSRHVRAAMRHSGDPGRGPAPAGQPGPAAAGPRRRVRRGADDRQRPRPAWREAAAARGDFAEMSPQAVLGEHLLLGARRAAAGRDGYADELVAGLTGYVEQLARTRPRSTTSPPRCRRCCCSTTTRSDAAT